MSEFAKTITRTLQFYWFTLATTFKVSQGRWFVFRDLPFWYVVRIAAMPKDGKGDVYDRLIDQASEELVSRCRSLEKSAMALIEALKR
jgi:hypothetical protein